MRCATWCATRCTRDFAPIVVKPAVAVVHRDVIGDLQRYVERRELAPMLSLRTGWQYGIRRRVEGLDIDVGMR